MSLPAIFAERERLRAARVAQWQRYHQRSDSQNEPGPLPTADPSARSGQEMPVLRLGVDDLPGSCSGCQSAFLSVDAPMGGAHVSTLSCVACGRVLAHLLPPPATVARRAAAGPKKALERRRPPTPLSTPEWRLSGCSTACMRGHHSPEAHEAHGRQQALAEVAAQAAQPTGVIRTGRLAVDFDAMRVMVDGSCAGLTVSELRIVMYLAGRLGQTCRHAEIVRAVWDYETAELWGQARGQGAWHGFRVHVARARGKLGAAAPLIETIDGLGYRLRAEVPIEPAIPPPPVLDWRGEALSPSAPQPLSPSAPQPLSPLAPQPEILAPVLDADPADTPCVVCGVRDMPTDERRQCGSCAQAWRELQGGTNASN